MVFGYVEMFVLIYGKKNKKKVEGQPLLTNVSSVKVNSIFFIFLKYI